MSKDLTTAEPEARPLQVLKFSRDEIIAHVRLVQQVMDAVMKEGVHYGIVPGTSGNRCGRPVPKCWA